MKIIGFNLDKTTYNLPLDNGGACLIIDGSVKMVINEERLNRKQYSPGFKLSLEYIFKNNNLKIEEIDLFVASSCLDIVPSINEVQKQLIENGFNIPAKKISVCSHHLSHAYSTYFTSGFEQAIIMVLDGDGNVLTSELKTNTNSNNYWENQFEHQSYYLGNNKAISFLERDNIPAGQNGLGGAYRYFTYFCGFPGYNYAGKLMGLSAYGQFNHKLADLKLFNFQSNGQIKCLLPDLDRLNSAQVTEKYLGENDLYISAVLPGQAINQEHKDIALWLQNELNQVLINKVNYLVKKTGLKKLCIAGGVGLNSVANKAILENTEIENIYIQPAAGDSGQCLGNALYGVACFDNQNLHNKAVSIYKGKKYSARKIEEVLAQYENFVEYRKYNYKKVCHIAAKNIYHNKIVAWFQDESEMGPRALGNRSILANPCNHQMKDIINERVKHREYFRPFAPSVLQEQASNWFDLNVNAPYMNINAKSLQPDLVPAITHVDHSARIQTVNQIDNPLYHQLISEFAQLSGIPIVLNTSFNDNEAIVETPADALDTFIKTDLDLLVIGNYIVKKKSNRANFDYANFIFKQFKKKAGNIPYAACFGKTFLEPESQEYKDTVVISELLVNSGFGIIHGGYSGIMEAASKGADQGIKNDDSKNIYWNIGVPMKTFDKELKRAAIINLPAANDISDRKKALVEFCDLCVVFSRGGMGTLLEALEIIHNNQIAEKFGGKIRPIIFYQGNWRNIMDNIYRNLDLNKQSKTDQYIYYANSIEELRILISKFRNMTNQWEKIAEETTKIQSIKNEVLNNKLLPLIYNNIEKNSLVFDYGCGWGEFADILSRSDYNVCGFDQADQMIEQAKQKFNKPQFLFRDEFLRDIEHYKNSFDLVISNLVLCILDEQDQKQMLHNIKSLIKSNGTIIISLCHPCFDYEKESLVSQRYTDTQNKYDSVFQYNKKIHENNIIFTDYHRPLEYYAKLFNQNGLVIKNILESDTLGSNHKPDFIIFELKKEN